MSDITKLLIVDDEENMLTTLEDIFIAKGFEVATVTNGHQAIEYVKKEKVDVILMDFKMPGINGVEASRLIREIVPAIKVIFITAYYEEEIINEALAEGAVGVCHKPLDITLLVDNIKNAVAC